MIGTIIIIIVVLFLFVIVAYLIHDSLPIGKVKDMKSDIHKKVEGMKHYEGAKLANAPVIYVKVNGNGDYTQYQMTKEKMAIGRSEQNDIVLEDETVEAKHAVVRRVMKDNKMFYEMINLSRRNPIQYLNKMLRDYDCLGYKKGITLENDEVFYLGETKIVIKCPMQGHEITKTERMIIGDHSEDSGDAGHGRE